MSTIIFKKVENIMIFVTQRKKLVRMDKEDTVILSALVANPRITLRKLCKKLKVAGISMSPEGARKRLEVLISKISFVPLMDWNEFGLELLVLTIGVAGGNKARKAVRDKLKKTGCAVCFETFGAADIIAFFVIKQNRGIPKIVDSLKELKEVKSVDYAIVSQQSIFMQNLFRSLG